jgi:hypothetical protein
MPILLVCAKVGRVSPSAEVHLRQIGPALQAIAPRGRRILAGFTPRYEVWHGQLKPLIGRGNLAAQPAAGSGRWRVTGTGVALAVEVCAVTFC